MSRKAVILISLSIFSTIGGLIPNLWDASLFSFSSIIFTAIGGIFGIWLGYKLTI
jgi:hypothetical protein